MSGIIDVNQRLLKIFGLEGQRVTSLTVHTEVDAIPTLAITRHLIEAGDVRVIEQVFDLQLRQETPAQPECEAMARVNAWIEAEAKRCTRAMEVAFGISWAVMEMDDLRFNRRGRFKASRISSVTPL